MNYATNRKMLVTMKLEAIVLLHLSSLFPSILFRFSTPPRQREKGGGEGGRKKKTKRNREL